MKRILPITIRPPLPFLLQYPAVKVRTPVTIIGSSFVGTTAVNFGDTPASSFTVDSETQITAVAGTGASGKITVATPGGTATSSADFTFIGAPTITSFSPTSGGTSTSVTITGTNFTGTTAVKFGGTAASSFAVNSSTQITATVGTGSTGKVTVTTPGGTATSAADFIYTAVAAGSYYVNIATGNDSNDGLSGNPWKTIHHAISRISIGSSGTYVLHVALGTYSVANGEADAWITLSQDSVTIIGEDGNAPVWDGTGATHWTWGIDITGSNVTLQNLDITGFSDNNEIGIGISSGSGSAVMNCRIYQNAVGVNIEGSSPEINRNKIYDNMKGIVVWANTSTTVSPTITNNSIYESTSAVMNYGILINGNSGVARPVIYHNSIDGGSGDGIAVEQTTTSILEPVIKYNIITRCDQYGIDVVSGATCTINYNDVWGNTAGNYNGCTAGPNDISQAPKNGMASELASDSPCIDVIPTGTPPGDPVEIDYPGYSRPKGSGFDIGACEYVGTITDSPTMPGGTGTVTDYRIFTVPLNVGTGADMLSAMEASLGTYSPALWRVFALHNGANIEINSTDFASLSIIPGMGFWAISISTNTVDFQGTMAPDGTYYEIEMSTGWHLFAPPWPSTDITLDGITVSDGTQSYAITDDANTLTQTSVWDYTGSGPYSGYEKRQTAAYALKHGVGYFLKVLSASNVTVRIPAASNSNAVALDRDSAGQQSSGRNSDEPPPGFLCRTGTNTRASSYGHILPLPPDGMINNDLPQCSECSAAAVDRVVANEEFDSGTPCECTATESITISETVTIRANANVTFKAPRINLRSGFHTEEGAVVNIKQE